MGRCCSSLFFYVFSLKFLSSVLVSAPLAGGPGIETVGRGTTVMVLFSGGFVAIFAVLSVYVRRYRGIECDAAPPAFGPASDHPHHELNTSSCTTATAITRVLRIMPT